MINCTPPFAATSPSQWQHMAQVPPMFGMPLQRQPMQSGYMGPTVPTPPPMYMNNTPMPPQQYNQPFRPQQLPTGPVPYMQPSNPNDDLVILHQEVVPVGNYIYPPVMVRGPMQGQCLLPLQLNQVGMSFISQHPPNLQQQPVVQLNRPFPVAFQQTQNNVVSQQPFISEQVQYRRPEQEMASVTSYANQTYSSQSAPSPSLIKHSAPPPELVDSQIPTITCTSPSKEDNICVDKCIAKSPSNNALLPCVSETQFEEDDRFLDIENEQEEDSDLLSCDEMAEIFGSSSSQTTLVVSPLSSDGSLTLCNSPVSPQLSEGSMSSPDDDDYIPTKDNGYALNLLYAQCQTNDNISQQDLGEEPEREDNESATINETGVSKEETSMASQQCPVLLGRSVVPCCSASVSSKISDRNSPGSCAQGKPCNSLSCSHELPEKISSLSLENAPESTDGKQDNGVLLLQKQSTIRALINKPVYQEKPSRILVAQCPCPAPEKEQSPDYKEGCVRPYLTTHFRLLFDPIPQYLEKDEKQKEDSYAE